MKHSDRLTHRAFLVGVIFKGIDGCIELIGGAALLLSNRAAIVRAVAWLTREELSENPHGFVANHVLRWAQHFSTSSQHFAALYLLAHGAIKIALVVGLLRGLKWSYPVALIVLIAFIAYQGFRLSHLPSWPLGFLTAVDIVVVLLIWREWRNQVASHEALRDDRSPER